MKIGSILENQNLEKRIAITPELVKNIFLGLEVNLIENYGSHLGINDKQFKDMAIILKDDLEILNSSNIIVQLKCCLMIKFQKLKKIRH